MGCCWSKDSDKRGERLSKKSPFQEIGAGISAGFNWNYSENDSEKHDANGGSTLADHPQGKEGSKRHKATPSFREKLVTLHSEARQRGHSSFGSAGSSSGWSASSGAPCEPTNPIRTVQSMDEWDGDAENGHESCHFGGIPFEPQCQSLCPKVRKSNIKDACRLKDIFATPFDICECMEFCPPVHPKSEEDVKFIAESLSENFVFSGLSDESTKKIVDAFDEVCVPAGFEVIRQGDMGDYFYVIQTGAVTFNVDGADVGTAGGGDCFGELALLYDSPRAATCVASDNCILWRIDQKTFRFIQASDSMRNSNESRELLRKIPFLQQLDEEHFRRISEALTTLIYEPGEMIVRKGDEGKVFYVVKSGEVKVTDIEVGQSKFDDMVCGPGGYFGERSLVTDEKRVANVTAVDKVTLLCLSKEDFNRVLGDLDDLILKCNDKKKLMAMPLFGRSNVSTREISTLTKLIKDVEYPTNHVFFAEGQFLEDVDRAVYIVRSGAISLTSKKGVLHCVTQGGYFGDLNFGGDEGGYVTAKLTAKAVEDCKLGMLTLADIKTTIGKLSRLKEVKDGESHPTKLDASIKMESLKRHHIIGVGTFGKVWLVSRNVGDSKDSFALKIQSKRDLITQKQVDGVIREKNIMASIDCPFVIRLYNTYQDDTHLFMLMQLVQGGELFSVVHTSFRDGIPEKDAQFYAAGVLEGLAYMHERHIVYRDLKPENVLIGKNGYTVIVDLGFAKIVEDKTYTLCGTPLYLAPEVILSRGHDKGADYWSWGILVYEMVVGHTPFYKRGIEQLALLKAIVKGRYTFPRGKLSLPARDLVKKTLVPQPINRLGCMAGGGKDIHEHEWFGDLDLGSFKKQETKAPWVPELKGELDASNFNDWSYLSNKRADKNVPLTKREQDLFKDF